MRAVLRSRAELLASPTVRRVLWRAAKLKNGARTLRALTAEMRAPAVRAELYRELVKLGYSLREVGILFEVNASTVLRTLRRKDHGKTG